MFKIKIYLFIKHVTIALHINIYTHLLPFNAMNDKKETPLELFVYALFIVLCFLFRVHLV